MSATSSGTAASRASQAPKDRPSHPNALAALTADAALVLSGDTGMAHLAAAYARPAVTLAGPVPPRLWGPPPRPWHRVLWAGSTGDPHGGEPDPGLLEITVGDVIDAAREVLAASRVHRPTGRFRMSHAWYGVAYGGLPRTCDEVSSLR